VFAPENLFLPEMVDFENVFSQANFVAWKLQRLLQ